MFIQVVGIIALSLHTAGSQGNIKILQRLASPGDTVNISCSIPDRSYVDTVTWYKEEQDQSLHKTNVSYIPSKKAGKFPRQVNLTKSNVQRKESGVYYCAAFINQKFTIMSITRLIISDASRPGLSILVPSPLEGAQLNYSIPLLCIFFNPSPDQDAFSWSLGGETSQEQKDVDMIDGEGVFSMWSLKLIPPERRTQGMAYSCSDQDSRNITAVVPTNSMAPNTGDCLHILYFGLPCILLLLVIQTLVLVFRKHLAGEKPANQNPAKAANQKRTRGEISQTYAEIRCNT